MTKWCNTCEHAEYCRAKYDEYTMGCSRYIKAKSMTNFKRITQNEETLAEFIYCLIDACDYAAGNGTKKISQYANEDANDKRNIELIHGNRDFGELLDWLNEESKE